MRCARVKEPQGGKISTMLAAMLLIPRRTAHDLSSAIQTVTVVVEAGVRVGTLARDQISRQSTYTSLFNYRLLHVKTTQSLNSTRKRPREMKSKRGVLQMSQSEMLLVK